MTVLRTPTSRATAILGIALLWRVLYHAGISASACLAINLDPISDMETFHRWALSIAGGDWVGRGDFHPFHPWQAAIAPRDQWDSWYGRAFHQEPLYPYLVALIYLVAPSDPRSMILVQHALGAAGCAAVYLAARRIAPEGAALAAGLLSAVYGPYLYYESLLLRDSLLIPLHAVLLWTVVEARAASAEPRARRWWAAAGLCFGLSFVAKASILPFFLVALAWRARSVTSASGGGRLRAMIPPAAAFCLVLAPVAARNLAVGAPPLKITTRGPIELINGNNPWHPGIGWSEDDPRVGAYAREILSSSGGRLLPTAWELLRRWSGDPAGLARLQVIKAAYLLAPYEMPNNASYAYFRLNSPLLRRLAPSFYEIAPLALVGLVAAWPRRREFSPIYAFLAIGAAVTVVFYVIARFRAPLMPAVMILAGLGLWTLADRIRARRWGAAAAGTAGAAAVLSVNLAAGYPDQDLVRPRDYFIAMNDYQARGLVPRALREAETARRLYPSFAEFHRAAGLLHLSEGRRREALEALREALERDPSDVEVRRQVEALEEGGAP